MKRATTSAVQTAGRMVAAVYRNGGVTRREAMISCCDHGNLRQEHQLGIGMRRNLAQTQDNSGSRNRMLWNAQKQAERYSDRHSIRT